MSETKRLIVNAFGLTQEQWEEVEKWDIKQMPILPLKGHNSNATPIL